MSLEFLHSVCVWKWSGGYSGALFKRERPQPKPHPTGALLVDLMGHEVPRKSSTGSPMGFKLGHGKWGGYCHTQGRLSCLSYLIVILAESSHTGSLRHVLWLVPPLWSLSVCSTCPCLWFHFVVSLFCWIESSYRSDHRIFVFHWLASFT